MTGRRVLLGPALRVSAEAARLVTAFDIIAAAAVAYVAVPCLAGLLAALTGPFAGPLGPAAVVPEFLSILFLSGLFAWMTAIVAVPAALICAALGVIGWAAAMIGGAVAAQSLILLAVIAGFGPVRPDASPETVAGLAFVGAVYGLAGWAFLRWRRPSAFRTDAGAGRGG